MTAGAIVLGGLIFIATCTSPPALPQRCTNTHHGFAISYPAGWHREPRR